MCGAEGLEYDILQNVYFGIEHNNFNWCTLEIDVKMEQWSVLDIDFCWCCDQHPPKFFLKMNFGAY